MPAAFEVAVELPGRALASLKFASPVPVSMTTSLVPVLTTIGV